MMYEQQNYGGYPQPGYPPVYPQDQRMQEAYNSQYSPFIQLPPQQPQQQYNTLDLADVYVKDGKVYGTNVKDGPIIAPPSRYQQTPQPMYYPDQMMYPQNNMMPMQPMMQQPYYPNQMMMPQPGYPVNNPMMYPQNNMIMMQPQGYPVNPMMQQPIMPYPETSGANPYDPSKYNHQPGQQQQQNFNPYPSNYNPNSAYYNTGAFRCNTNPYGYTENDYSKFIYNMMINEVYDPNGGGPDIMGILRDAMLTDDEIKSIPKINETYGNRMYTNEQIAEYNRQAAAASKIASDFWVNLSMGIHGNDGVTEDQIRMRWDPQYRAAQYAEMQRLNAPKELTPAQMAYQREGDVYDQTVMLAYRIMYSDLAEQDRLQKVQYAYSQIKASHDATLGIKPGEDIGFKEYSQNAYKLVIDANTRAFRRYLHDGRRKFNSKVYKGMIDNFDVLNNDGRPIGDFTDHDYIPIEYRLRDAYDIAKTAFGYESGLKMNADGTWSPATPPPPVSPEEERKRNRFIEYATKGIKVSGV